VPEIPGKETRFLGDLAKELDTYIIAQMVAKDPELMENRIFNIAFVIDPKGNVIHKHYKTAFYQREPNVAPSDIWNVYLNKYGDDPVKLGLVASLARPGGNVTGINFFSVELAAKRLELLRELVPKAVLMAVLVNPANSNAETTISDVHAAARAIGLQIQMLKASTSREINVAFSAFARERPDCVFIASDGFFSSRRVQLAHLATRHALPAVFSTREFADVGGLMSYGANLADTWRQVGVYAGRILKGAKPADLPVVQSTKFELVINAETARMLGLTVPPTLLARADEVIEWQSLCPVLALSGPADLAH
jgi:hypothetical protein